MYNRCSGNVFTIASSTSLVTMTMVATFFPHIILQKVSTVPATSNVSFGLLVTLTSVIDCVCLLHCVYSDGELTSMNEALT